MRNGQHAAAARLCEQLGRVEEAVEQHTLAGSHGHALALLLRLLRGPLLWSGAHNTTGWPPSVPAAQRQLWEKAQGLCATEEQADPGRSSSASTSHQEQLQQPAAELHALRLTLQAAGADAESEAGSVLPRILAALQAARQLQVQRAGGSVAFQELILGRAGWEVAVGACEAALRAFDGRREHDTPAARAAAIQAALGSTLQACEAWLPVVSEALRVSDPGTECDRAGGCV